jgi:hypothetical protein
MIVANSILLGREHHFIIVVRLMKIGENTIAEERGDRFIRLMMKIFVKSGVQLMEKCYPLALPSRFALRPSTLTTVVTPRRIDLTAINHPIHPTMKFPITLT